MKAIKQVMKKDHEPYRVPKRVQDVIPIKCMWSDGIFLVGTRYSKTFKFTDINYMVASQEAQKKLFLAYAALINSLDCGATTKITLNNRHLNRKNFADTVLMKLKNDYLDYYRMEYNDVIMSKATGGNGIIQEKYVLLLLDVLSVRLRDRLAAVGVSSVELLCIVLDHEVVELRLQGDDLSLSSFSPAFCFSGNALRLGGLLQKAVLAAVAGGFRSGLLSELILQLRNLPIFLGGYLMGGSVGGFVVLLGLDQLIPQLLGAHFSTAGPVGHGAGPIVLDILGSQFKAALERCGEVGVGAQLGDHFLDLLQGVALLLLGGRGVRLDKLNADNGGAAVSVTFSEVLAGLGFGGGGEMVCTLGSVFSGETDFVSVHCVPSCRWCVLLGSRKFFYHEQDTMGVENCQDIFTKIVENFYTL